MAKAFSLFLGIFLVASLGRAQQSSSLPLPLTHRADLPQKQTRTLPMPFQLTVPADTEVSVQMLSGIHTQVNRVDDLVTARLLQPVYVNGKVALPAGSVLDGRITLIRTSGHLHRPAELGLRFERIVLPGGEAEPIAAILSALDKPRPLKLRLDSEGHLVGTRAFSWKSVFGGMAAFGGLGIAKAAAAGAAGLPTVLPLGGAALVACEVFLPKGNEVNLPPETRLRLRLNFPLTVWVAG